MKATCTIQQEGDDFFFDSREEVSSLYGSCLSSPSSNHDFHDSENSTNWVYNDPNYEVWISNPSSIEERRSRFMKWIGLDVNEDRDQQSINRIPSDDVPKLISSSSENSTSTSSWFEDEPSTSGDGNLDDSFEFRITNLDDGSVYVIDPSSDDGDLRCLREVGSNRSINLDEFDRTFGASSFVQKLLQRQEDNRLNNSKKMSRSKTNKWLKKLGAATCITGLQSLENDSHSLDSNTSLSSTIHRIKVRANKKKSKEFSSLYKGQDFKAHDGAILTMKFSPDGKYLASAGEDGVVRVWEVIELERRDEFYFIENDPSCFYFKVDHKSKLTPYYKNKEMFSLTSLKKVACVVVPHEVFRISEKPLHEFFGHEGDVLDLSWSNNEYLLSSSIDKTARLWKVGCVDCQKIFVHNNYVTCVQFNPVDDNYFVSGSIDGKVRIWDVKKHCVVDWIYIRDIVTALCYSLDGKKIVIGSMTGTCRFYNAPDHRLLFDAEISLQPKKKSHDHRITGLQYCPSDHQKLLVTSGDSRIHILDGLNMVSKYKGLRNTGSQIAASFTSDGKHIVSASEDSKVYIWNHTDQEPYVQNDIKSNHAYERFTSNHVSVATSWNHATPSNPNTVASNSARNRNTIYLSPTGGFTASHDQIFPENLPKCTATWPEEKLPSQAACKSQYKFLNTSCGDSPHAWGQVIVTAGWDGRIRSFQNFGLPLNLKPSV